MPRAVFDVFACCDVFVLSIRAMYALAMVFICASNSWRSKNLNEDGTLWDNLGRASGLLLGP